MNPQDNSMEDKMPWQLTEDERRRREVRIQVAVNKLERMEHHIPPREGEHCYFNSTRSDYMRMGDMIPAARYVCVTDQSESIGVDFSVEKAVDTYYSRYIYQGKLESIKVDHGPGPLWRQRMR